MLNYSVQVGEFDDDAPEPQESQGGFGFNPFPGLRPFSINESHLYFGREGQVDDILVKLSAHRSVTVMGYSGSGKSSLMHCGLVPVLYGGFMTQTGPHWHIVKVRPGASPIANLADAIIDYQISIEQIDELDREIHKTIISSVLRSSPDGLVEIAKYIQSKTNENVFFMIDQFEELFRYDESSGDGHSNDATAYVNLILNAVHQTKVPVYVALNMRSDFIGECSTFTGLTQMINASNYLVPQMTREQKRMAIEGPIAVGGGKISTRLVKKLLADIDRHQDQLPILQHALMRTWDYWVDNRESGEPMDLRHYNAIGRIEQALSLHANEAYDELTSKEKEIAEILFKNVTEKGEDNTGMRRPVRITTVSEIAEASDADVIKVVENFRKPGRSFLMPDASTKLTNDSVVELSHESIMRIWNRLAIWVDEESESAQTYKRISEAAAMYQIGKTGLWRPPDLQLALNWQKKQRPTRSWAQRYDIAFERAIVFLDTSRITYEAELKNQELLQKRALRRARTTNIVLVIFLLVAIAFFLFGLTQQIAAEREAANAKEQQKIALEARDVAESQTKLAEEERQRAEIALAEQSKLTIQLAEQVKIAEQKTIEAERNLRIAEQQTAIAVEQTGIANEAKADFEKQYIIAQAALKDANRLLYLSVAQSMEAKSVGIDDPEQAGLLAMQGYLFHTKFEGKRYDPYVFSGLYYSLAKLNGSNYNALFVPGKLRNRMYSLAVSKNSNAFYTTGNDGRIFTGDFINHQMGDQVGANPFPNRVIVLSKDEKYLVNGGDSSFVQVYTLDKSRRPLKIEGHHGSINDIKFLPNNAGFISTASDRTLRYTDHLSGDSRQLLSLPFSLKSIDISGDGNWLAGVATSGELIIVNLNTNTYETVANETPNRVLSVAYHPTRNLVAYGVEIVNEKGIPVRGTVKLFDNNTKQVTKELSGHRSGISAIRFSPDGLLLASAGLDRKLQMWVVDQEEDLPILMDNNNGNIWDIGFAKDSNYLIASCNNGEIRIWPTDPKMLAEQVCPKLTRNMTPEEWEIYVANGIEYETTCKSLLISDF
ncbi:MAG TPA: hypothetical protein PK185_16350 [Cyclobacteriaceae bacterium]|nr:hypothetical protein [Cyclobacteriaceae bacterium]